MSALRSTAVAPWLALCLASVAHGQEGAVAPEAPQGAEPDADAEPADAEAAPVASEPAPTAAPLPAEPEGPTTTRRPPAAPRSTRSRTQARYDMLMRWAPRYRILTQQGPVGLEEQLWDRVDALLVYHRVALDMTELADGRVSVHLAGWGALDLLADSAGAVAAGDVAIGYADLRLEPVTLWLGRRFLTYGPPGGLHVDGGGVLARFDFGLTAEAFVGRPVTPTRSELLGPQPSFEGAAASYGARIGYSDPGRIGVSTAYTESWGHGIVGSRVLDSAGHVFVGGVHVEGALKLDLIDVGVLQGQLGASVRPLPALELDVAYAHLEPGRWIPRWSILSVFETSTFDELVLGATVRPLRPLAVRLVAGGRRYDGAQDADGDFGYRLALTTQVTSMSRRGSRARFIVDRRDDGVIGFTILQAGFSFDPIERLALGLDGSFAIDDDGERESVLGEVSADVRPIEGWTFGLTLSVARTPIAPSELRALLRAGWAGPS